MSEPPISRGFCGRRGSDSQVRRVPPGQHVTTDFPVLSAGPTPDTDLENWSFGLFEGEALLAEWSWVEFDAFPQTKVKVDIHCMTTWSKLDSVKSCSSRVPAAVADSSAPAGAIAESW